jgi:predicted alpha/beta-fold hydrolase
VVALDIAFPVSGHNTSNPVYLVLHGLSGGSQEKYVRDFVVRRAAENATVAVMVARGLMDLPVRGMNIFHGARWEDPHQASLQLRRAILPRQLFAGVGFSMGAIILSNLVARTGTECALDVAVAISGGLDTRHEINFRRAQRLWQPPLATQMRGTFVVGKWGERVRQRLTNDQMKALMRATHVSAIDETAVVVYHRFRDLVHYYSEMSVLGDVPYPSAEYSMAQLPRSRRM